MKDRVELLLFYNDSLCKYSLAPLSRSAVVSSRNIEYLGRVATTPFDIFPWLTASSCGSTGSNLDFQVRSRHIIDFSPTHLLLRFHSSAASVVGVKGAESGGKLRSYRRPFHPDYCFPRMYNPGEKGADTSSS